MTTPKKMQGHNTLTLCMAEMIVALQEYINRRLGEHAPFVKHIKASTNGDWTFAIELTDEDDEA